jgi:phosphosulfolactate synthase
MAMNFELKDVPKRTEKTREQGITMVMDKGMSCKAVEDLLDLAGEYIDYIKLGFGSAFVTPKLEEKLNIYRDAGIPAYFGGTLFEAFVIRDQFEDYMRVLDRYNMEFVEVSDGSLHIPHDKKLDFIYNLSKQFTVLSEVGSKDKETILPPYKWIELMEAEFQAGSYKVIAEARESGTVGIFRETGEVRSGLVDEILTQIRGERVIWEAPKKPQQVWFIKLLGQNVNLGNISPEEVIPLETMRIGMRADTFSCFMDKNHSDFEIKEGLK